MFELKVSAMLYLLGLKRPVLVRGKIDKAQPVRNISIFRTGSRSDGGIHVRLSDSEQYAQGYASRCTGLYVTNVEQEKEGIYLICEQGEFDNAVNEVYQTFYNFILWREHMNQLLNIDFDLYTASSRTAAYLKISLQIIDRDYRDRSSKPWSVWPKDSSLILQGQMTTDAVEMLYLNDTSFYETFKTRGLTFYLQDDATEERIYYYNIYHNGEFLSRILVMIPCGQDTCGLRSLLTFACEGIEQCKIRIAEKECILTNDSRLSECLAKILCENQADRQQIAKELEEFGWHPDQRYEVIFLRPVDVLIPAHRLEYLSACLNSMFPQCAAVEKEHSIICIHNRDIASETEFYSRFSDFIRDYLLKAGISNEFQNIFQLPLYAGQAAEALTLGQKIRPQQWKHAFSDYFYEYALHQIALNYPPDSLRYGPVAPIEAYDLTHPGIDLMITLYHFLASQFNATEASKRLFIHRTTFVHRMKKIEELTHLDLHDPKLVAALMLYMELKGYPDI